MQRYAVPLQVFEPIRTQVPARLGALLLRELERELAQAVSAKISDAKLTAKWSRPLVLEGVEIRTFSGVMWVLADEGSKDATVGRRPWRRRPTTTLALSLSEAEGPEWIYPGDASGGIFRDAVAMCLWRGSTIIERLDAT